MCTAYVCRINGLVQLISKALGRPVWSCTSQCNVSYHTAFVSNGRRWFTCNTAMGLLCLFNFASALIWLWRHSRRTGVNDSSAALSTPLCHGPAHSAGEVFLNTSPVKDTTGYDPASLSHKSQFMTTRPSCPTFHLSVQHLLPCAMSHAPVEFTDFKKFFWWTLLLTFQRSEGFEKTFKILKTFIFFRFPAASCTRIYFFISTWINRSLAQLACFLSGWLFLKAKYRFKA